MECIVNNTAAWDFPVLDDERDIDRQREERNWEQRLAILDTAILSLIGEHEIDLAEVATKLDEILSSSLWSRRLARLQTVYQEVFTAALKSRTVRIWSNTSSPQRRGYFLAGVG